MEIISVIIAAYNCSPYIDKCIESILSQTYQNIEIIIVNDGSSDDTWSKISQWTLKSNKIIAINTENRGVVLARRKAMSVATGEFLTFVDGDDYLPTDALEKLYTALSDKNADMALGSYSLVWENSGKQKKVNNPKEFHNNFECIEYCLNYGETFLPIKLYKKELFLAVVDIPSDIIIQEDTIAVVQYLIHSKRVAFTCDNVYFYLKHAGTATATFTNRHQASLMKVSQTIKHLLGNTDNCKLRFAVDQFIIKDMYSCLKFDGLTSAERKTIKRLLADINWKNTFLNSSDCTMVMRNIACYVFSRCTFVGIIVTMFFELIFRLKSILKRWISRIFY